MFEEEWLACEEWLPLWYHSSEAELRTERKTRLFASAGCRSIISWLFDSRCLRAIEICEAYADDLLDWDEVESACEAARREKGPVDKRQLTAIGRSASSATQWLCYAEYKVGRSAEVVPGVHAMAALIEAGAMSADDDRTPSDASRHPAYKEGLKNGDRLLAGLLREIIGNPFRPATLADELRTKTVTSLARAAYEERDLPSGHLDSARLGVLADALEEEGCVAEELLAHLRSAGPHVRGCWALDLVLGKK